MATDQTWWALTQTPEMKFSTKAVLCAMAIVSSEKHGKCHFWQSTAHLAKFLGCSRTTVYHHINLLCAMNLIKPTDNGYLLCVPGVHISGDGIRNMKSGVQETESGVQETESSVQEMNTIIEREDKETYEEIMGRGQIPELVEKKNLVEKAKMIGVDPAFAEDWYDRWYANGSFWVDSDMSKPLKPMGRKLGVLANRLKAKWESERDQWSGDKKRGGLTTWELKERKQNLSELMKVHPGNPKNEGGLGAEKETKREFRKLRDEHEQLTKKLAGV